jgi:fatty acid desaturase
MVRILFLILLCYLLTRFIFGFLVPVVMTAIRMRRKMREMHDQMHGSFSSRSDNDDINNGRFSKDATRPSAQSEYIDFEEVK